MHCITNFEDLGQVGFHAVYESLDGGEIIAADDYGLNEGMTKYLENKRSIHKGLKKSQAYPILNIAVENLIYVIGDEEALIDSYFNNPEQLFVILEGMPSIGGSLDKIYHEEKKVIKLKNQSSEERLFRAIWGEDTNSQEIYDRIGSYMVDLNGAMLDGIGKINTLDDFKRLAGFAARLKKQEYGMDENQIYGYILEKARALEKAGFDLNEINDVLQENDIREEVDIQREVENLMQGDRLEVLNRLASRGEVDTDILEHIKNCRSYEIALSKHIFSDRVLDFDSILNIGKFLKQNPEINIDDVSILKYKGLCFNFEGEMREELPYEFYAFEIEGGEKKALEGEGKILGLITERGIEYTEYIPSNNRVKSEKLQEKRDELLNRIADHEERLKKMKGINVPEFLVQQEENLGKQLRSKLAELENMGGESKLAEAKQQRDEAKAQNGEAKKLQQEVSEELNKRRGKNHEEQ